MENNNEDRTVQILAAEAYLNAKRNMLPSSLTYVYTQTYNYLLTKLKRYV